MKKLLILNAVGVSVIAGCLGLASLKSNNDQKRIEKTEVQNFNLIRLNDNFKLDIDKALTLIEKDSIELKTIQGEKFNFTVDITQTVVGESFRCMGSSIENNSKFGLTLTREGVVSGVILSGSGESFSLNYSPDFEGYIFKKM